MDLKIDETPNFVSIISSKTIFELINVLFSAVFEEKGAKHWSHILQNLICSNFWNDQSEGFFEINHDVLKIFNYT